MIVYKDYSVRLYSKEVLEFLKIVPTGSIDLFFTSPPYNLSQNAGGLTYKGKKGKWVNAALGEGYESWNDSLTPEAYLIWQQKVISEMWRILPEHGAIFYNHKPRIQNQQLMTRFDLIPEEAILRQVIIWKRPGGINFNATNFLPTYEWIFLIAKKGFRLKSKGASGIGDVWEASPEKSPHPAPFPISLPFKVLDATEPTKYKIICDPFCGQGTVGAAVLIEGSKRKFIGNDISKKYLEEWAIPNLQLAREGIWNGKPISFPHYGKHL